MWVTENKLFFIGSISILIRTSFIYHSGGNYVWLLQTRANFVLSNDNCMMQQRDISQISLQIRLYLRMIFIQLIL